MKPDKKSSQVILILVGIGIPLTYLVLSFIFSEIADFNLLKHFKLLLSGFVIFSTYYISYPLFIIKYPENQDLEKRLYKIKISHFVLASYPSFLGFFLTLINIQIIYSIIGTAISIVFAILIFIREDISLEFIHLPSHRLYGISFFGWYYIISAIINLYSSIFYISGSHYPFSITRVVSSIILIGIGIGILLLINAVRIFVLIISSFFVISTIITLTMGLIEHDPQIMSLSAWGNLIPRILLSILLVIYFSCWGVKHTFIIETIYRGQNS